MLSHNNMVFSASIGEQDFLSSHIGKLFVLVRSRNLVF